MTNGVMNVDEASKQFAVNRQNQYEVIRQPLYDFQTYPAAGATEFIFFQVPKGQGGKTIQDTNMEAAGQLPTPKKLLISSIEVWLLPGDAPVTEQSAAATTDFINNVYDVLKEGHLQLFIGSKAYLDLAPLMKLPPSNRLFVNSALADATTAAAALLSKVGYASACGPLYSLKSEQIWIPSTQNFEVTVDFSTAIPMNVDARIGVMLNGQLYRLSQ